jgi:hypothetical protein
MISASISLRTSITRSGRLSCQDRRIYGCCKLLPVIVRVFFHPVFVSPSFVSSLFISACLIRYSRNVFMSRENPSHPHITAIGKVTHLGTRTHNTARTMRPMPPTKGKRSSAGPRMRWLVMAAPTTLPIRIGGAFRDVLK